MKYSTAQKSTAQLDFDQIIWPIKVINLYGLAKDYFLILDLANDLNILFCDVETVLVLQRRFRLTHQGDLCTRHLTILRRGRRRV